MHDPRPPADAERPAEHAAPSRALARVEGIEHEVEQALNQALERGERSLARRFGAGFVRGLRVALRGATVALVLAYFLFGALLLAARWWALPQIDRFRPQIEAIASRAAGTEIRIGHLTAGWDSLNPRFSLEDVRVGPADAAAGLTLPRLDATLSWTSLLRATPIFTSLVVRAPEIALRRLPGDRFEIAGFALDPAAPGEDRRLLDWLLAQDRILITGAQLRWSDERNPDAPCTLDLARVELLFESGLTEWRFGLQAVPPADLAAPFDLRGRFARSPFAAASDYRLWRGEVYAEFDELDLARLTTLLDLPWQLDAARGASRAWLAFDHMRITRVAADVALADVRLSLAPDRAPLELDFVRGRLTQSRRAGEERLGASGLAFRTRAGVAFGPADLGLLLGEASASVPARGEFSASGLELDAVAALLPHLPIAPELRETLLRHGFTGQLSDLQAQWRGPLRAPLGYSLRSSFSGLSSRAMPSAEGGGHAGLPGFAGLAGRIEATDAGGSLRLASRNLALDFPGVFEEPRIAFDQLDANLRWTTRAPLEVRIESASLRNADLEGSASGVWRATGGAGSVDLSGRVQRLQASTAYRYVPLVAGHETIVWLQEALRAGQASDGQWRLRGRLADFPFTAPASGEFRVTAKVAGVLLDYVPGGALDAAGQFITRTTWPALTGIDADLVFERAALDVFAQRGEVLGLQIQDTHARIPHLGAGAAVQLKADLAGPLAGMLRFANASPVAGWLGHFLDGADARGPARLGLRLEIPLAATERTQVAGTLTLQGSDLTLAGLPAFTRASGAIGFTERSLRVQGLGFNWLGGPARLDASTQPDGAIVLNGTGRLTAAGLRSGFEPGVLTRLLERAQGETRYTANLTVKGGGGLTLRADSDLSGLAINLPPPLRKPAGEAWPLRVSRQPGPAGSDTDEVRLTLGDMIDVALERSRRGNALQVARGSVALGDAATLPAYGMSLNANFKRLDLDAWIPAAEQVLGPATLTRRAPGAPAAAAGAEALRIDLVALRAGDVVFDGKTFANVVLGATHTAEGSWNANLASDSVSGALNWRPAGERGRDARLVAQFSRLSIPDRARDELTELLGSPSPVRLPAVELSAEQFELGTRRLGRLEIAAVNNGPEQGAAWTLQKLAITNPDARLSASGQWTGDAGAAARRMELRFAVDIRNAGGLLDRLGIRDAIKGGSGKLEGEAAWRGSPFALNYPTLDGKLALELDRGQFLKAEPGAARLLSVLSLQSVARRLTLDFRDLFSEGFAFDSVRADARLTAGVLTTHNFRMAGPAATVLIDGAVNLRAETQNLHVVVLPDINANSASLALAIANPVLGLGSFLAQMVLKDPLAKLFSLEYDVTGTWSDPHVRKLDRSLFTPAPSANSAPPP